MTTARTLLPESQLGPAERLLDVVLGSSAHLWHNRPGVDVGGAWGAATSQGGGGGRPPGLAGHVGPARGRVDGARRGQCQRVGGLCGHRAG